MAKTTTKDVETLKVRSADYMIAAIRNKKLQILEITKSKKIWSLLSLLLNQKIL